MHEGEELSVFSMVPFGGWGAVVEAQGTESEGEADYCTRQHRLCSEELARHGHGNVIDACHLEKTLEKYKNEHWLSGAWMTE